jgi:predicted PurR-regulated permease PerM
MTTLVGAFAGVGILGFPGILLGPLGITYFFELLALYREEYGMGAAQREPQQTRSPAV